MHIGKQSVTFHAHLSLVLALCLAGISNASFAANVATYKITVRENLKTLDVFVTPSLGHKLSRLRPLSHEAWDHLNRHSLHGLVIRRTGLAASPGAEHYRYSVDIRAGLRRWIMGRLLTGNRTRLTDSREWFWVPHEWHENDTIRVEFDTPEGLTVSAPWERLSGNPDETSSSEFFIARRVMLSKKSVVLFGQLQMAQVNLPGGVLNLAIAAKNSSTKRRYVNWTARIARSVVKEFGHMPVPSAQVVILPTWYASRSPVPWGEVRRGNGSGLVLMPKHKATMTELVEDWTLYHEFTHLYHPYLGSSGRWVAEGFASYYQNVLRAKAGVITAEYAWERMAAGFGRGARDTHRGSTVANAGLMRTYWTGAVMALELDMRLRQRYGTTLGNVLGQFSNCCLPATHRWRPMRFMRKLDEISDSTLFTTTYRRYSASKKFPDYENLLKALNIDTSHEGQIFGTSALRDSIMKPLPGTKYL